MEKINFDPRNYSGMVALMDRYGEGTPVYGGTNEHGENITIGVSHNVIEVTTYQDNGWTRVNAYHRDGTREEMYEGRWR